MGDGMGVGVGVGVRTGSVKAEEGAGVVRTVQAPGNVEVVPAPSVAHPETAAASNSHISMSAAKRPCIRLLIFCSPPFPSHRCPLFFPSPGICRPDFASIIMDGDSEEAAS